MYLNLRFGLEFQIAIPVLKKLLFKEQRNSVKVCSIVLSVFSDGVIFIESNYDNTPKNVEDAVVGIRYVSEKEFRGQVQAFSVYYIK